MLGCVDPAQECTRHKQHRHDVEQREPWHGWHLATILLRNSIAQIDDLTVLILLMRCAVMTEVVLMAAVYSWHARIVIQMRMGTPERRQDGGGAQDQA